MAPKVTYLYPRDKQAHPSRNYGETLAIRADNLARISKLCPEFKGEQREFKLRVTLVLFQIMKLRRCDKLAFQSFKEKFRELDESRGNISIETKGYSCQEGGEK